jgi:CubicO group peptidase (beta-lactamase class C family)
MADWITRETRLFRGGEQVENFRRMSTIYPVRVIRRASSPSTLERGVSVALPETFEFQGQRLNTAQFLAEVETTGMMVIRDGQVEFEDYWLGGDAGAQTIGWSVSKSFVSALIGIAIDEGAIASVEDPVSRYAPELAGGGYDGMRLKDVLQMSSGVRWNEDYSDPGSDIASYARVMDAGGSIDAFAAACVAERPPGTFNRYNTTDTHVLGMVLRRATGRSLVEYLRDKLWAPLGMEADGFWMVDGGGAEMAGVGLNAVLRDFARLGCCYLNDGAWNGVQIGCPTRAAPTAPSASTTSSSGSTRPPAPSSPRPRRSEATRRRRSRRPTAPATTSRSSPPSPEGSDQPSCHRALLTHVVDGLPLDSENAA